MRIGLIRSDGRVARMEIAAETDKASCPQCGSLSPRVHSRYERRLADTSVGGQELVLQLRVRRFFCENTCCPALTFAEQFPALTERYARRTGLLSQVLTAISLALGGRAGSRLSRRLHVEVSRSTLLRLIRAQPVPEPGQIVALGVDDFAFRRGSNYGTVLVDMLTRQPVDLLADRLSDTFADWLEQHPGAQVICRDRAGGYAEGARQGAPDAIQVADRWHLLHNLTAAVDRIVRAHSTCLRDEPAPVATDTVADDAAGQSPPVVAIVGDGPGVDAVEPAAGGRREMTTRQRHDAVHELHQRGLGTAAIARRLGLDRKTVRRYRDAAAPEQLLSETPKRGSQLDAYFGYLAHRWDEDATNAVQLTSELRERGYRGSERSVRRLLQDWRGDVQHAPPKPSVICSPREMTMWMMRPTEKLSTDDHANLCRVLDGCPTLNTVNTLVSDFAGMLRERQGQHLDAWITAAHASELGPLRSFAVGRGKDYDAVRAGLSMPWSSGAVEGQCQQAQDDQTADVRTRQLRPTAPPRPARPLTSRNTCQSHFFMATDSRAVGPGEGGDQPAAANR
jgi:transposase